MFIDVGIALQGRIKKDGDGLEQSDRKTNHRPKVMAKSIQSRVHTGTQDHRGVEEEGDLPSGVCGLHEEWYCLQHWGHHQPSQHLRTQIQQRHQELWTIAHCHQIHHLEGGLNLNQHLHHQRKQAVEGNVGNLRTLHARNIVLPTECRRGGNAK